MRFKDKTVVVTGRGSGIGRAIALGFAREGARVLVASHVEPEVRALADEVRTLGGRALAVAADVRHSADMDTMAARAIAEWGSLDVLVTAAGIDGGGLLMELDEAVWTRVIDVNLNGTYRAIRATLPQMMKHGEGRIITISSVFGKTGGYSFILQAR